LLKVRPTLGNEEAAFASDEPPVNLLDIVGSKLPANLRGELEYRKRAHVDHHRNMVEQLRMNYDEFQDPGSESEDDEEFVNRFYTLEQEEELVRVWLAEFQDIKVQATKLTWTDDQKAGLLADIVEYEKPDNLCCVDDCPYPPVNDWHCHLHQNELEYVQRKREQRKKKVRPGSIIFPVDLFSSEEDVDDAKIAVMWTDMLNSFKKSEVHPTGKRRSISITSQSNAPRRNSLLGNQGKRGSMISSRSSSGTGSACNGGMSSLLAFQQTILPTLQDTKEESEEEESEEEWEKDEEQPEGKAQSSKDASVLPTASEVKTVDSVETGPPDPKKKKKKKRRKRSSTSKNPSNTAAQDSKETTDQEQKPPLVETVPQKAHTEKSGWRKRRKGKKKTNSIYLAKAAQSTEAEQVFSEFAHTTLHDAPSVGAPTETVTATELVTVPEETLTKGQKKRRWRRWRSKR